MDARELINSLELGRTDYSNAKFPKGLNLTRHRNRILKLYGGHLWRRHKLNFDNSELVALNAENIKLPEFTARNANLREARFGHSSLPKADFSDSDLTDSDFPWTHMPNISFKNANLEGAQIIFSYCAKSDFTDANLQDALFQCCDLTRSIFRGANVENANFYGAVFVNADLRGIKDLDKVRGLGKAVFYNTKMTRADAKLVRSALAREQVLIHY